MTKPLDFYYWPTPNGWKISILLEELGIPYSTHMLHIGKGEQFTPEFLAISPNNRMPAIVDHDVTGDPVSVFESGAIMWYLAEKTGQFLSEDPVKRKETLEWLFWQTGNQGPMAGQHSHFHNYAPDSEKGGYAAKRYAGEYTRCLGVLERRLEGRDYIVDDYSIADMMCWPWVLIGKAMGLSLDEFPNVIAWRARVKDRPAVQRGVSLGKDKRPSRPHTDAERKILFGQK
ncbi:glutathione S-transferase N-terminal domain-containing protein [Amylibacter sp. IMCC11727]|uniref:glutathione S-transferase N-terminal domain-containing protein n=1 Tax=Amylibacter sp. IMCC11727 TaxID=3039851 RepID=UPI00244E5083|nr:glutathione S-transferase N-terminal domain-containing protein [Amylibacter sp. IMCC11727]WGI21410.1 glutathione S-transferase N-terminal domain-containing protein [Amylibacter sp. IMCC11727]